jgi:hypothetical protein
MLVHPKTETQVSNHQVIIGFSLLFSPFIFIFIVYVFYRIIKKIKDLFTKLTNSY